MTTEEERRKRAEALAKAETYEEVVELRHKVELQEDSSEQDWSFIFERYREKFPENSKLIDKENHTLSFSSEKDADNFFNDLAKEKVVFLATWVIDGKLQDKHHFSCGTGSMYQGSFAEISKQLEAALPTATPADKVKLQSGLNFITEKMQALAKTENVTSRFKETLQSAKEESRTAPTPFNTRPKTPGDI